MTALTLVRQEPTITRLLAAFFADKSPHTLDAYRRDLDDFVAFLARTFGLSAPSTFGSDTSQPALLQAFLQQGAGTANELVLLYRADLKGRGRAPATVNRHVAAIRSLTKLGRMIGLIGWSIEVGHIKAGHVRDTRGPGVEVVREMLAHVEADDGERGRRDVFLLRLLFDLGLRCCEITRLDRADVDPATGTIWILGKGRDTKELLTLPPPTRDALARYLERRGNHPGPLLQSWSGRAARDARLTTRGVYSIVRKLGWATGRKVWPHGIRHTSITQAVIAARENGIGLEEVRAHSRHKSINTLMVYRDAERNVQGQLATLVADQLTPTNGNGKQQAGVDGRKEKPDRPRLRLA